MEKSIIKFSGKGCVNCRVIAPIFEEIEKEYPDIVFKSVDADDAQELTEKYCVTSLPTLVFLKDGEIADKLVGLKPKSLIVKKIVEIFG
jgi:thioredoxin 1